MRRHKNSFYLFVLIIIFTISVGYAILNSNIVINGKSSIKKSMWNLYFDNIRVIEGSVESIKSPTIENSNLSVDFNVMLDLPGDFYEFTVDLINYSTMDAKLDSFVKTPELTDEQKKYINYVVEYENGNPISANQIIPKFRFVRLKVKVEYKTDIEEDDLPSLTEMFDLSFTLNFIQSDGKGSIINDGGIMNPDVAYIDATTQSWEELPGISLYDSINLKYDEMYFQGRTSYPKATEYYIEDSNKNNHIFIGDDRKILNLKNTFIERNKSYKSVKYNFTTSMSDDKLRSEDYVATYLDLYYLFEESFAGMNTSEIFIYVFGDSSDTYVNVAHTLFFSSLNTFVDPKITETYEQELIGEYILGFPAGYEEGCATENNHNFFYFMDENNNILKITDNIDNSDYRIAMLKVIKESDMTWEEAKVSMEAELNTMFGE